MLEIVHLLNHMTPHLFVMSAITKTLQINLRVSFICVFNGSMVIYVKPRGGFIDSVSCYRSTKGS